MLATAVRAAADANADLEQCMARRDRDDNNPSRADLAAALGRYQPLFGAVVEDWNGFIDALLRPLPTCIWTNPTRIDAAALQALIAEEGV
ncbi:MAG: hypothetical protein WBG92_25750, partial [Thiohalocapsa sp.]